MEKEQVFYVLQFGAEQKELVFDNENKTLLIQQMLNKSFQEKSFNSISFIETKNDISSLKRIIDKNQSCNYFLVISHELDLQFLIENLKAELQKQTLFCQFEMATINWTLGNQVEKIDYNTVIILH